MVSAYVFAAMVVGSVAGALVFAAAATGYIEPPKPKAAKGGSAIDNLPQRLLFALGGMFGVALFTGWPVGAFFALIGGFLLPTFAAAKKKRRESIERVEAIASWVESLRDTMAASAGIQQAIKSSAQNPPRAIRTEVKDLALRLQHQTTEDSLRRFAGDLRHPASDLVVSALLLASSRRAGSLQEVLRSTARSARDSASMLRHVEAGRTRVYSQARTVGWATAALLVFLVGAKRDYVRPFDSFDGQLVIGLVCLLFLGSGTWIYRLGKPVDPHRVFDNIDAAPTSSLTSATRVGA